MRRGSLNLPLRFPLVLLALAVLFAAPARARPADGLLDLLHLGSRSQLGLGGDPFLSPLEGETGWWDDRTNDGDRSVALRQRYAAPITRRLSDDRGLLDRSVLDLSGRQCWRVAGRTLRMGFTAASTGVHSEFNSDLSRGVLQEEGAALRGEARLLDLFSGLDLQAEVPLGHTSSRSLAFPLRYGVRYRAGDRIRLEAHRSHSEFSPSLVLTLEEERVDSPLNMSLVEINYGARIRLVRSLAVESSFWEGELEPNQTLSDDPRYEFLPVGYAALQQHEIGWGRPGGLRLLGRYSRLRGHGRGNAYWGGQRYARMTDGHLDLDAWLAGFEVPLRGTDRLVLDVTTADYHGFIWSKVESWPFLSWQTAWLNGAKVAQVTLDGRWDRYHLGCETRRGRARWTAGLSWYELRPELTVDSWTKVVLGKADRQITTLNSDRYSLAAVSLGGGGLVGPVRVQAGLHQFVYADDHRDEAAPPTDPGQPRVDSGWFGGTYAEISVTYIP